MANSKRDPKMWMQTIKRNAVVATVVLFVCVAVYLNWNYQNEGLTDAGKTLGEAALVGSQSSDPLVDGTARQPEGEGQTASADAYFADARINRQQARDNALSILRQTADSPDADQTTKAQAGAAIQTMAGYTVTEAQIENLVVAKGYADCVAFIGEDSLSVVVQVPEGELTAVDTARITDIAVQETGMSADRIRIIDVAGGK